MEQEAQVEEKKGSTVGKFVGALGGGAAAYKLADVNVARRGLTKAITADGPTTPKFDEHFISQLDNRPVARLNNGLGLLKEPETITKARFIADKGGKGFSLYVTDGTKLNGGIIPNIKAIPEGFTVGRNIAGDELNRLLGEETKFLKPAIETAQKELVTTLRKAGGHTFGFRASGALGKSGIVGATVVGAGLGAMILNKVFGGGKHASAVAAERTNEAANENTRG